jgi:hypothetical protein
VKVRAGTGPADTRPGLTGCLFAVTPQLVSQEKGPVKNRAWEAAKTSRNLPAKRTE